MGTIVHIIVEDRAEQAAQLLAQVNGITQIDLTQHNGTPRIDVTIDPESGLMVSELPNRLIAQGFRPGNFKPSADTIAAISEVMRAAGVEPPPAPPRPVIGKPKQYEP